MIDIEGNKCKLEQNDSREKTHWWRLSLRCQLPLHHFLKYEDRCLDETIQVICIWFALSMKDGVLLLTCPPPLHPHPLSPTAWISWGNLLNPTKVFCLELLQKWRWALVNLETENIEQSFLHQNLAKCSIPRPLAKGHDWNKFYVSQVSLMTLPTDLSRNDCSILPWKLKPDYGLEILFILWARSSLICSSKNTFMPFSYTSGFLLAVHFLYWPHIVIDQIFGKKCLRVVFFTYFDYFLSWDFGDSTLKIKPMRSRLQWKESLL